MTYRNEIDGLRAIAVLSVIIAHTGLGWMPGGFAGVDIFFVISGFLITGIILRDLERGAFSFRDFYARRARRIFPALFAMLAIVSILAWLTLSPSQIEDLSASVFFSVLFLSNGYFLDFVDYFAPASEHIMLLHTWSLGIEEQFYILFPLIALLAFRIAGRRGLFAIVIVLLLASFALSEWGWRNEPRANYFFSPSRFWEILLGSLVALLCARRDIKGNNALAMLGLFALCLSFFIYNDSTLFPSFYTLLPTLGTALVLVYAQGHNLTARLLQLRPLRLVGLISFSAYLWHQPVFVFARIENYDPSEPSTAFMLIGVVLFLSALSWRVIEQPFRASSSTIVSWQAPALWTGAVGLIALSLVGYFTNLPLMKFNAADQRLLAVTRSDANDYQRHIGQPYERRIFGQTDPRPKVAFIGDSFGRDLMNVLNERGILEGLDVSYWIISNRCAPFFLLGDDDRLRDIWDVAQCVEYDRYSSPEMLDAIANADIIVLASLWRPWQISYVVETIDNIKHISPAAIILSGPKSFGQVSTKQLLRMKVADRPEFRSQPNQDMVKTNEAMKHIEGVRYINIVDALCDPNGGCQQVTKDGELISVDGGHLTQAGATLLGAKLDQQNALRNLFKIHPVVD